MVKKAFIGLGSNMGDKEANIGKALEMLGASPGIRLKGTASLYRTDPVGYLDQDWFLNTVTRVETELDPHQLLKLLLAIEDRLGRVRTIRWGPRPVDLDLLLYGGEEIHSPGLIIPHPRMCERAFVMAPLAELAPGLVFPGRGTAAELAGKLAKEQWIEKYE